MKKLISIAIFSLFLINTKAQVEISPVLGYSILTGDVSPVTFPKPSISYGISGRVGINSLLSVRAGYLRSTNYGMDYRAKYGSMLARNTNPNVYLEKYGDNKLFLPSYKTKFDMASVDLIFSLHNGKRWNIYTYGAYNLIRGKVMADALDRNGSIYDFSDVNFNTSRKEIWNQLRSKLDGNYESIAPVKNGNRNPVGIYNDRVVRHGASIGGGVAFKVTDRFNIGVDHRMTQTFSDDFDGIQSGIENDNKHDLTVRFSFNIGKTQPKWWLPSFLIINNIHNTYNSFVDLDTDGDGVTDSLDLEKITLQKCFPVDSDGVGSCPEIPCCTDTIRIAPCDINTDLIIKTDVLSRRNKNRIENISIKLKASPECKITITGHPKFKYKADMIRSYLIVDLGISPERIKVSYDGEDREIVEINAK